MTAGIAEADAHAMANELTDRRPSGDKPEKGGIDGGIMANGQGRLSQSNEPMYGTQFRRSQDGGASEKVISGGVAGARKDSPAMALNDDIYAPFGRASDQNEMLGGMVDTTQEPRSRFARTASSGV